MPRPHLRGAVAAALLAACVSCTSSDFVTVPAPTPTGANAAQCQALLDQLRHQTIGGLSARAVSPSSPYSAAWGDPAVTVRCGVAPRPPDSTTSELLALGVSWRERQVGDVVVWEVQNRATGIEVRVPQKYSAQDAILADLAPAVNAALPTVSATPAG